MMIRRFARCSRGAAIVEFAVLAPVFIVMLVGLFEYGRAYWVRQTIKEVSFQTARCMAMEAQCKTQTQRLTYAVDRAKDYSVTIPQSAVTVRSNISCRGQAGSHEVAISTPFKSPLRGFGVMPETLTAQACFPVFTAPT